MWSDSDAPYRGTHYILERTLNVPQSIRRPGRQHPPILIGGSGEKKTLRFVAQYAQACNLFGGPDLQHKLDVLKRHCDDVGRDYDDILKTVIANLDPGRNGEKADAVIEQLREYAALGIQHVHTRAPERDELPYVQVYADKIIPVAREL